MLKCLPKDGGAQSSHICKKEERVQVPAAPHCLRKLPFSCVAHISPKDKAPGQAFLGTSPFIAAPLACLQRILSAWVKGLRCERGHRDSDHPWGHKIYLTPWTDKQEHGRRSQAPAARGRQYDGSSKERTWGPPWQECESVMMRGGVSWRKPIVGSLVAMQEAGVGVESWTCGHQLQRNVLYPVRHIVPGSQWARDWQTQSW